MKGSGVLLEVTAPAQPDTFDRFIARSGEFTAAWAVWAISQRSITSTQKLIELGLASQLIIRATPFTADGVGTRIDLLRLVSAQPSSGQPIRLTSRDGLATLQRRLALRPDDELELIVDARGVLEALPVSPAPVVERGAIVLLPGLPALAVGATLVDPSEVPIDPDPPEEREVSIPASAEPLFDAIYAGWRWSRLVMWSGSGRSALAAADGETVRTRRPGRARLHRPPGTPAGHPPPAR